MNSLASTIKRQEINRAIEPTTVWLMTTQQDHHTCRDAPLRNLDFSLQYQGVRFFIWVKNFLPGLETALLRNVQVYELDMKNQTRHEIAKLGRTLSAWAQNLF
jgi:hypothetical protein